MSKRLGFLLLPLFASLGACTVSTSSFEPSRDALSEDTPPVVENQKAPPPPKQTVAAPVAPYEGPHVEVVYVEMKDREAGRWICTGALVAKNVVVTAAHCLDPSMFVSWKVVAALAPGQPQAFGHPPAVFGGTFEDVANPDIGILTLKTPIALPVYAELTDVVARVESGEKLTAAAVVRSKQEADAPLVLGPEGTLTSTVGFGYEHGFGVPMFSKGGDSGAGLFLVEDGKLTHKLVGIARQPEPQRNIDHFTRIDAEFLAWFAKTAPPAE